MVWSTLLGWREALVQAHVEQRKRISQKKRGKGKNEKRQEENDKNESEKQNSGGKAKRLIVCVCFFVDRDRDSDRDKHKDRDWDRLREGDKKKGTYKSKRTSQKDTERRIEREEAITDFRLGAQKGVISHCVCRSRQACRSLKERVR